MVRFTEFEIKNTKINHNTYYIIVVNRYGGNYNYTPFKTEVSSNTIQAKKITLPYNLFINIIPKLLLGKLSIEMFIAVYTCTAYNNTAGEPKNCVGPFYCQILIKGSSEEAISKICSYLIIFHS